MLSNMVIEKGKAGKNMTILKHELKINLKTLFIWMICVGFSCFGCILLFGGLKDTMEQMEDAYAQMGAFSSALGLDRMSVSTMEGFYATEVALIYAIGGAMFAAMTGVCMLSKEEEGHTSEFLYTLPLGRSYIVWWKYFSVVLQILLFNLGCICWVLMGFLGAGEIPSTKELMYFHGVQFLMHMEIGSICFCLSAFYKRKQVGAALGFAVLLYVMDLMCRIVPDIENLKYVTPYYFSNATDIFVSGSVDGTMLGISVFVTILAAVLAAAIYHRRDIAA